MKLIKLSAKKQNLTFKTKFFNYIKDIIVK
jgi:hypothetical protein